MPVEQPRSPSQELGLPRSRNQDLLAETILSQFRERFALMGLIINRIEIEWIRGSLRQLLNSPLASDLAPPILPISRSSRPEISPSPSQPTTTSNRCRYILHHNHLDTSFDHIVLIDAKGIQKADEIERGHQVYQMGTIYSRPCSVCLWLGVPDTYSYRAILTLREASKLENMRSSIIDDGFRWHSVARLCERNTGPGFGSFKKLFW
jgi:hypothetical protein